MRTALICLTLILAAPHLRSEPMDLPRIIRWLLEDPSRLEGIPFPEVIAATTGHRVLPLDANDAVDAAIVKHVRTTALAVMATLNAADSPLKGLRRINEASKFFEDHLVKALNNAEFTCTFPLTAKGDVQRSGYPDLQLVHRASARITYLDPKLFEKSGRASTLRTFYFEPRGKTNKVTQDAHHLLLGFAHDGKDGAWQFLSLDVIDVFHLKVRLKAEFEASNKDVYRPDSQVGE